MMSPMPKQPPKPKGDTNIRPRWSARHKRWVYDVTYPQWSRGHLTLEAARTVRNAMRADSDRGALTRAPARMTVGDLVLRRWLPAKEAELTNRHSVYGCKRAADLIDDGLGKHELRKLTPLDVERFKQTLVRRFNSGTAAQYFGRLSEIMQWAVDHDLLLRNPAARVKPPKVVEYKAPAIELAQIRKLVEAADATPYGMLVWLAMNTGLRINELLALTWSRIDTAAATLRLDDAKSPSGVRTVALAPVTIERLQAYRLEQLATFTRAALPPPSLVFLNDRGVRMLTSWWWWRWNAIRSAAALPSLRFHDLRHVHASLMGKAKVHPSVMQERLGHAHADMSITRYTHVDASQQVDAALAVEGLILGSSLQTS